MAEKNAPMPSALKEQLREYAYQQRMSMGAVIAQIIVDYANGELSIKPPERVILDAEVKYLAPPEYNLALTKAMAEGLALSEVIRLGVASRVHE